MPVECTANRLPTLLYETILMRPCNRCVRERAQRTQRTERDGVSAHGHHLPRAIYRLHSIRTECAHPQRVYRMADRQAESQKNVEA